MECVIRTTSPSGEVVPHLTVSLAGGTALIAPAKNVHTISSTRIGSASTDRRFGRDTSTNEGVEVVLYIDVSLDGSTTFTTRAKNAHVINSSETDSQGRQMQVWFPLTLGTRSRHQRRLATTEHQAPGLAPSASSAAPPSS